MVDGEKVIKALRICIPETQEDSKLECSDCPYGDVCNPNDIVGITLPLIWDIRELLKEQEAVEPRRIDGKRNHFIKCGSCNCDLLTGYLFCPRCGKAVKWE